MKRRFFIKAGIGGMGIVSAASFGLNAPGIQAVSKRMIREDTKELKIRPGIIDVFIAEAEEEGFFGRFSLQKRVLISLQYQLSPLGIKLPYFNKYREARNEITGQFLLSTSLFYRTSASEEEISYIGFYNPYKTACVNPFSAHYKSSILTGSA